MRPVICSFSSLCCLFLMIATTSCQRRATDQPTGPLARLGGKQGESRQVHSDEEFGWTYDQEGYSATAALDAEAASGPNYLNPGEKGVPSYERFTPIPTSLATHFQPIYFSTNDDLIRGRENFSKVTETAHYLKNHPKVLLFIEGHCDKRGAAAYNLSLGARRAGSIRNQLIEQGVEATRLFTITFGKERPAREGDTEEAFRWNRRVEYKLFIPK